MYAMCCSAYLLTAEVSFDIQYRPDALGAWWRQRHAQKIWPGPVLGASSSPGVWVCKNKPWDMEYGIPHNTAINRAI
jgi:hypothetical protein